MKVSDGFKFYHCLVPQLIYTLERVDGEIIISWKQGNRTVNTNGYSEYDVSRLIRDGVWVRVAE